MRTVVGKGKKRLIDFIAMAKNGPLIKIKFLSLSPAIGSALGR